MSGSSTFTIASKAWPPNVSTNARQFEQQLKLFENAEKQDQPASKRLTENG